MTGSPAPDDADGLLERLDARSARAIQHDLVASLRSALDDAHAAQRRATRATLARLLSREAAELARLQQTSLPLPLELAPRTAAELLRAGDAHDLAVAAAREARSALRAARARRRGEARHPLLWEVL